ncbi:MAG: hypothetical protein FJ263_04045 [Planctomycetes bacterium]|nr:hypothetical protein [Planctomycetota bacterium]
MLSNMEVLEYSVANPESYVDEYYEKEYFIITENKQKTNRLIEANNEIVKCISAYDVNSNLGNDAANESIIKKIIELLNTPDINNSEFTSFWEINDISFSMYAKFSKEDKIVFMKDIVPKYIKKRHQAYQSHGYTATTLQVKADSFGHKRSGNLGLAKVAAIFEIFKINKFNGTGEDFCSSNNSYIFSDQDGKAVFDEFKRISGIEFGWQKEHKGKRPDFVFRINDSTFIIEHKHMKEGGGGQDKQIVEISSLISYSDKNVSYVGFLDGIYFNKLFSKSATGKILEQRNQILTSLKERPCSYFLNTMGFLYFLSKLKKS